MKETKTVYLAGPDVFLPNALEIGEMKKAICTKYGLRGRYPLDTIGGGKGSEKIRKDPRLFSRWIFEQARKMLESCDIVLANMTPFRGPSADSGTVWEVAYAMGKGIPVHAYTCDERPYHVKISDTKRSGGILRDREGRLVEDFGCMDNVMIDCSIEAFGGIFLVQNGNSLKVFEELVKQVMGMDRKKVLQSHKEGTQVLLDL